MVSVLPTGRLRYLIDKNGWFDHYIAPETLEDEFGVQLEQGKRKQYIYIMSVCTGFVYDLHMSVCAARKKHGRKSKKRIDWDLDGRAVLDALSRAVTQLLGASKPNPRLKMVKWVDQETRKNRTQPLAVRAVEQLLELANELQRMPTRVELKNRPIKLHPSLKMENGKTPDERKKNANRNKNFWSEQLKIAGLSRLKPEPPWKNQIKK